MAHDPARLQAVILSACPEQELSFRPMFGGIMGYADGKVFASLSDVGLALKMAGADHAALSAIRDAKPLRYAPDQPASKSYVVVPDAMLAQPDALGAWVRRCIAGLQPAAKSVRQRRPPGA